METAERLQYLEEKILHQERLFDQLSDVILEHGKQIEKLEEELFQLRGLLQAVAAGDTPENIKPPHY